ncbi:MAG: class IV adenylate cyclase [Candidatus Eisenbacteria bacterium]
MTHLNVELKARCADPGRVRRLLAEAGATGPGTDLQRDVYFVVPEGRLKLRRGTIERSLVFYRRADEAAVRRSEVTMARLEALAPEAMAALEDALGAALGVRTVVEKRREIRFVDNVKFHLDDVPGLGCFVEIEAIDLDGSRGEEHLRAQCDAWRERLGLATGDLVSFSYADVEPASSTPGRST